jgi:nitrite reductase (NADH) small subunit
MTSPVVGREAWSPVCKCTDLELERGATALVNGHAVALFRMGDDEVYALGNHDPFARTGMLARGIVGRRDDVPFVGSATHKQAFDLRTGHCLDDPSVHVPTYQVRIVDGVVLVGPRAADPGP